MVTREAEWDDYERNRMLALAIWEAGLSPCGHHSSLTSDKSNLFVIEEQTCSVCASLDRYRRIQEERDKRSLKQLGEKPAAHVPHPGDGRRTFVRQLSDLEVAERRAQRERERADTGGLVPTPDTSTQ